MVRPVTDSEIRQAEAALKCDGCSRPIVPGMHYMKVRIELETHLPGVPLVREVSDHILEATVHHPGCLTDWASRDPILINVFSCR
jgi:hypothetical protein